jgi:hypothetical protein
MLVVSAMCFADTEFGGAEQVYEGCKNICIAITEHRLMLGIMMA